jgi:hypothetical protein
MSTSSRILVAALAVATSAWVVAPAAAAPIGSPLMLQSTVGPSVETVRYYGHHHGGAGIGLGIAGALIGGAILGAATQPYGYYGYLLLPRSGLRRRASLCRWRRSWLLCATLQVL